MREGAVQHPLHENFLIGFVKISQVTLVVSRLLDPLASFQTSCRIRLSAVSTPIPRDVPYGIIWIKSYIVLDKCPLGYNKFGKFGRKKNSKKASQSAVSFGMTPADENRLCLTSIRVFYQKFSHQMFRIYLYSSEWLTQQCAETDHCDDHWVVGRLGPRSLRGQDVTSTGNPDWLMPTGRQQLQQLKMLEPDDLGLGVDTEMLATVPLSSTS